MLLDSIFILNSIPLTPGLFLALPLRHLYWEVLSDIRIYLTHRKGSLAPGPKILRFGWLFQKWELYWSSSFKSNRGSPNSNLSFPYSALSSPKTILNFNTSQIWGMNSQSQCVRIYTDCWREIFMDGNDLERVKYVWTSKNKLCPVSSELRPGGHGGKQPDRQGPAR